MSKLIKRGLAVVGVLTTLIIAAAIAIPYHYKDKFVALIKEEASNSVKAKIDFADVDLSLFTGFPNLKVRIEEMKVKGIEEFEDITLFECPVLAMDVDLIQLWKSESAIPIMAINAIEPVLNILVLQNGTANWDIVKPSEDTGDSADYLVQLQQYGIDKGHLIYNDKSVDLQLELLDLNHTGSGNFTASDFDLNTQTSIASMDASMNGIPYLNKAIGHLDAIIGINLPNLLFTLKDNQLKLNELALVADGTFKIEEADYKMDLNFNAPKSDFKSLCSLLPSAYTEEYKEAEVGGTMTFNGFVKGTYSDTSLPAFQIKSSVNNGSMKYPDLPTSIHDVFTNISVNSPSSDLDKMVVDIPQFTLMVGDNPIEGNFNLKTPISDPKVNTHLKGMVDLAQFAEAYPIDFKRIKGIINSDIAIDASMSQIEKEQYNKVDVRGQLTVNDLVLEQENTPTVSIKNMATTFSPQSINLTNFDAFLGESDLKVSGKLMNLLAYFHPETTMEGDFKFRSNYFNINEWAASTTTTEKERTTAEVIAVNETTPTFDRFNFSIDGAIKKLEYDTYTLTNMVAKGKISPNELDLNRFYTKIDKSDIAISGTVKNLYAHTMDKEMLTGRINLTADYLDLNQFMAETSPTTSTENVATEAIVIPDNINLRMKANIKKVHYTDFDIRNIKGQVVIKEGKAVMEDVKGRMLGGNVALTGGYDTSNPTKPGFDIKTDLVQINFKEAFNTFNTFQALAPIGKYLDGEFSTNLSMNGLLGKNLEPELNSLNVDGFVHILEAALNNFKPIQAIGDKLNVDALKKLRIKDSKNWITVKNGVVSLQEFSHQFGDITMTIGGTHSLTQDMNYTIKTKIPRNKLNNNKVGAAANRGWNFLSGEANKLGVNLQNGEFVNIDINLSGSIANPKYTIKPTGVEGKAIVKNAAKSAIKSKVGKALGFTQKSANGETNTVKGSLSTTAKTEREGLKQKGKDVLKKRSILGFVKTDSTDNKALKDTKKSAKDKLKSLNPFRKKKKKND